MVAPPRVPASLNSYSSDNEWVIICMEARKPAASPVQYYCCKAWFSAAGLIRLRRLPLFPRLLFFYFQLREWKQSENAKCKEILNWHMDLKHHLPLCHQLHHLSNDSRHDCFECVRAAVPTLYTCILQCEWQANRDVLLQLWAQGWCVFSQNWSFSGWVHPWEWLY